MRRSLRSWSIIASLGSCLGLATAVDAHAKDPQIIATEPTVLEPWQQLRIEGSDQTQIVAYLARSEAPAPLVVLIQGSPCHPLFRVTGDGAESRVQSSLGFLMSLVGTNDISAHFVAVERPGLTSFDGGDAEHEPRACTAERGGVSKEGRVHDVAEVVRALSSQPWTSAVIIAGHSEGADVATGVADELRGEVDIAALGLFAGAGPSQMYDGVVEARRRQDHAAAAAAIDVLIQLTGDEPPPMYSGHPSARWQSFAIRTTQLMDVDGLQIPLFVVHGTADANHPIESADAFVVEALRAEPDRPLRYVVASDLDHGFRDAQGFDHGAALLLQFLTWTADGAAGRSVETWTPPRHETITRYFGIRDRVWFVVLPIIALVGIGFIIRARRRRRRGSIA